MTIITVIRGLVFVISVSFKSYRRYELVYPPLTP